MKYPITVGTALKQWFGREHKVWFTAVGVAALVATLRLLGSLQSLELMALDQIFRSRPPQLPDDRIVIVGLDDSDINQLKTWPLTDALMARLLERIQSYQPRAIGLDIYRDVPVGEGQADLQRVFETTPNLIGIEKLEDGSSVGVPPPTALAELDQVGFNNVVVDVDSRVRRSVLFWKVDGEFHDSFALKLAMLYLETEGITAQPAAHNPDLLQLGQGVFDRLQANDGSYVRADIGGYQILANLSPPNSRFTTVSLTDVLEGKVSESLLRDRIVLIGSTASSLKDFFYTPYSSSTDGNAQPVSGVELHANFISQFLDAALEGRSLIRVIPDPLELLWIAVWSWVGASVSWRLRLPLRSGLAIVVAGASLVGICYVAFLLEWWIPLVPPLLALFGSAVTMTSYIAYLQEELKKSKEFLNSVINTIPDPIFVKDQNHRWIVLNRAYCRFIGYPLDQLLDRSEPDFLPVEQAAHFWQQDNLVFKDGIEQEAEEEFTDANGVTYAIATKRSLHQDAAGNVFLVGVIRDITQRKKMEEDLKRTAAELVRSNAELRQAEDRLRRMAYHDALTGLPNRELLSDRLNQSLEWAQEHDQLVALLFLDLDGFKQINDTYGHDMGNLLLKAVAQRLTRCLRSSDTVARYGGDEFVVLLPAIPSVQDIARVADKILQTLTQQFVLDGKVILVSTSIGISIYPRDTHNQDELIKKADIAMYEAKGLGKNCYQFFQADVVSEP
ncbi:CHASE2 domain-containing protein [Oscillatoria sp. FACHB-1407]|uniref:CHASE2 domain-containing protein n=1 Tax=Oscillatoria sp. FACHB-1407 TaxID=2692847 RepID=UPI0016898BE4|nr:CHASE2 domain-containing protein [Oscillatoria sp. FACHB-1407]MBD2464194.1 CHASE2 domain-containing protein [Oscillatoria sp. FACHB-1407]